MSRMSGKGLPIMGYRLRALWTALVLFVSVRMFAVGWTPTDAGLVLNFETGDQFLLSVMVDGKEYFVCDYPERTPLSSDRFNYPTGNYLKLLPQPAGATEPSPVSIWTVGDPLPRIKSNVNYALGGISYTMRSYYSQTLITQSKSAFKFLGDLAESETKGDAACLCDVVFVVPTVRATTNMDPNGTLNASHTVEGRHRGTGSQSWAFDGKMGYNSDLQLYYREVYWFDLPRSNDPNAYTNAALVTFNTTGVNQKWGGDNPNAGNNNTVLPGRAAYAYSDPDKPNKHNRTTRTLFRIYPLNKPFSSCGSYFFGWDVQDYVRYRQSNTMGDSTAARKIFTLDHFECMVHETEPDLSFFRTEGMQVPPSDSTYFYVGYNNKYLENAVACTESGSPTTFISVFKPIDSLRVRGLREETKVYKPSKKAFGYMAIDTLSEKDNLGVAFEPAGYFLRTNTGTNVRLVPDADRTKWTCEEMWTITDAWSKLSIKATLFTGPEFSMEDPGADIEGWSEMVVGNTIKVKDTEVPCTGKSGWAQIDVTNPAKNGGMVFIEADSTKYIRYNYNGHFGNPIPNQHPELGKTEVAVQAPRLLGDYEFICWTNVPDTTAGEFTKYNVGDPIDLSTIPEVDGKRVLVLYAQAQYKGSINVAISFLKEDGKRYFLTHPNTTAPRFARSRTFTDWTNVYQGMSDAENTKPNYMSSYKIIGKEEGCKECETDEYVLDPRHETMKGAVDSLVFYEHFTPESEEYIGLYYDNPYTILANTTWAGLFTSTGGWPTPANPCVNSTKISSSHYLTGLGTTIVRTPRGGKEADSVIVYNAGEDQFDGGPIATGTGFMISGVGVVDDHYVILPDTTDDTTPWLDEITFDYHEDERLTQQVWSKLIGKQLLAQMKVGDDTIYFHPNRDKIFNTASGLRLSSDFRLRHEFQYIYDTRAAGLIAEGDSAYMEETENGFYCIINSGVSSPIGPTQDIVDTLRVWLRPIGASKIKEYYGRWKDDAVDSILPDGSRYRDILIKTRTYHYVDTTDVVLQTEMEAYSFGALAGLNETLTFNAIKKQYRILYDSEGNEIRKEVIGTEIIPGVLDLRTATATLKESGIFTVGTKTATGITLTTKANNEDRTKSDTLTVSTSVTISGKSYDLTVKVPLMQSSLQGEELIWSVVHPTTGKRFFITIEDGALRFRPFDLNGSRWQRNKQELKLGSKNANNSDHQYITPWKFTYAKGGGRDQLSLKTLYGVNRYFKIFSETTPGVSAKDALDSTLLTYEFVQVYTNNNANIEEQVKLKYGESQWLQYNGTEMILVNDREQGSVFSWGYLSQEYQLLNNGPYPSVDSLVFDYNNPSGRTVQTRYKAYREYSMLINNQLTYVCREDSTDLSVLNGAGGNWKLGYTITRKADARDFDGASDPVSGLGDPTINTSELITTITPGSATSPTNVKIDGKYVNIVDTLLVTLSPQEGAPTYRFKDWKGVSSWEDAALKIPLVRMSFHTATYDSVICEVENDEHNFAFPATLPEGAGTETEDSCHTFVLYTLNTRGTKMLDADGNVVAYNKENADSLTKSMDFTNRDLAEIRLIDDYGKKPDWCQIQNIGKNTITMKCLKNGTRSPRMANIYFAYIVRDKSSKIRFVNFKLTVSQASLFQYANNQTLSHSRGYTGDEKVNGMQQVHENKRILYYYNPAPYEEEDQNVELPVRERDFYGWWRWYREGKDENGDDVGDMDVPDSLWITPPRNVGKFNYPFRIIGDSVDDGKGGKKLVTMGRYTVFHYPAVEYNDKKDPPAKSPLIMPPYNKDTLTYVVDLSNYYDNLPLSMTDIGQVDTAALDTIREIIEPTLSLREIFELHPWTEMAERMENYKTHKDGSFNADKYMEDHVVMAPTGNPLLLSTEQRYRYDNLQKNRHSESLLGYYMRDDNWNKTDGAWASADDVARDTMIWCGGWDADCEWYIYDPEGSTYTLCTHTVTESDDFLSVPAKGSTTGSASDTVIYCLRARSKKTEDPAVNESEEGDYWFNICRYKVVYHDPKRYGPWKEEGTGKAAKAIITNDEIEQDYEVLERLNFDYIQPGKDYHVYPHPLPWGDASYGYSYPMGPEIPDNRYHNDFAPNFPGPGEYGIINRIPYSNFWHKMEQHGGAENGYMIYCDGMSSSGQVAALSLSTHLCEGQKMYFSAFVGNPSTQTGKEKARPNFTISVQGWNDRAKKWEDITTYMTGDIQPANKWYQIFFPIEHDKAFDDFRVRIYNMASNFDGNDFIIDDICVFATKPPLIAYQANTKCRESNESDSIIHVVLRVDYQGFTDKEYNTRPVIYTVEQMSKDDKDTCFVPMIDHYLAEMTHPGKIVDGKKIAPDTIYGTIGMPAPDYYPHTDDSVFMNLNDLAARFEETMDAHDAWEKEPSGPEPALFRRGYIYENLDGDIRPVLYVVHKAKMTADKKYKVRMSLNFAGLMSSICAMTSDLKVTNRMMLMLNGEEQEEKEVSGICGNTLYDVSLRVRGTLIQDSVAPMPLTGSCSCDWLLYGDTADATSLERYGYKYSDIEKVIRHILRYEPGDGESNINRYARNIGEVNRNVMENIQKKYPLSTGLHAYDVLVDLVNKGFLSLYQSSVMVNVSNSDSVLYVVFPIVGTGTDDLAHNDMEVCPNPILIKLKSKDSDVVAPLVIGGINRDSTQANLPVTILADGETANRELKVHIDYIRTLVGIHSVSLISTDDPNYREGVHKLALTPDKIWPRDIGGYYTKDDSITLTPASTNNYEMRAGYSYTYNIEMVSPTDDPSDGSGCPIGNVPMTVSVVPDILRWAPADKSNNSWNNPMNWLGVDANNVPLPNNPRFAPLASTDVILPPMPDSLPYPNLPDPESIDSKDSVKQVGFIYNTCDDIRFLAGSALGQQQRLTCDVVVADMTLPHEKWALRSAPVMGMLSGDLFMADADLSGETKMWSVGTFDAAGRTNTTGNAAFWPSVYSNSVIRYGNNDNIKNDTLNDQGWSKVTNALTLSLPPAQGWAVYTRTKSNESAVVRLPKNDDRYYYYYANGDKAEDIYEDNLRTLRNTHANDSAGQLAFQTKGTSKTYTLSKGTSDATFVFGNPTMGYIDIWGFIADNRGEGTAGLAEEIRYIDAAGLWRTVTSETTGTDTITNLARYLPPMHAIVVKAGSAGTSKNVTLKSNRIVTHPRQKVRAGAPRRISASGRSKGIMTVTATNSASSRCTTRLLLGQGYSDAVQKGEDAILTTVNIDKYSNTSYPATPFNIYAVEEGYGLSIDLLDEVLNVPVSFYMSNLPFDPVTKLWFTGVNSIDGQLVLYDAQTDIERPIIDGICLEIETPENSHEVRYYIRRHGYRPGTATDPVATGFESWGTDEEEQAIKYVQDGVVYILRNGHIYTIFGQKIR